LPNDTLKLYQTLAILPKMLGKELLPSLAFLKNDLNRGILAKEILQKKSHWLDEDEIKALLPLAKNYEQATGQDFFLEDLLQAVEVGSGGETENNGREGLNPYLTPLVLAKVNQIEGDEKRYEMLQGACQFNKDPILWITLVKYCRIIGLDQYGSANLRLMSEWISQDDLTEIQLKFL
jgi:hypothetical protein